MGFVFSKVLLTFACFLLKIGQVIIHAVFEEYFIIKT